MDKSKLNARDRIIEAVQNILAEGYASDKITVRQIAKRANVGIGTISYHFESKEKLIFESVSYLLESMAEGLIHNEQIASSMPVEKLRRFLLEASIMVIKYSEAFKLPISYEMTQGDMNSAYYIIPLLKDIFGVSKSELELKIIAIQIISTMESIFLKDRAFWKYSGIDIFDEKQMEEAIDIVLKNIINI